MGLLSLWQGRTHTPEVPVPRSFCRLCGKKGHIQAVCRSKPNVPCRKAPIKKLKDEEGSDEEVESADEIPGVYANGVRSGPPPIVVEMKLNGVSVPMEVDTGAAVSIVSHQTYCKHLGKVRLLPATLQLHTYTDERLVVEGKCSVMVEYKGQWVREDIYVVAGRGQALLKSFVFT